MCTGMTVSRITFSDFFLESRISGDENYLLEAAWGIQIKKLLKSPFSQEKSSN